MHSETARQERPHSATMQVFMDADLCLQHVRQVGTVFIQHFAPVRCIVPGRVPDWTIRQRPGRIPKVQKKIGIADRPRIRVGQCRTHRRPEPFIKLNQVRGPMRFGKTMILRKCDERRRAGARAGGASMTRVGKRSGLHQDHVRKTRQAGFRNVPKFRWRHQHDFERVPDCLMGQVRHHLAQARVLVGSHQNNRQTDSAVHATPPAATSLQPPSRAERSAAEMV